MRVIGTAGHVDHGKSTLVRRLTGIDPDRLAEEKARQMTIDLGFAWLQLPDGEMVGIVDVPGHRDFIENMLAGVGGIDAALLVIAADEGVMPQTREHLAILDLLGIQNGIIVLTKIDMVDDPAWVELVEHDILDVIDNTAFAHAEIVPVSALNGSGIPDLQHKLTALLSHMPAPADYNQPRLSVDRVFTMSGFGTVVTGTLLGGALRVGDEVELQPGSQRGRVRGLQSYKQTVEIAYPGSRVAVNISGIEKRAASRGQTLSYPGQIQPSSLVDVYFRHLQDASRPLKHNTEVKVFSGAAETSARVRLLNDENLPPGAEGWLQLRLENPLPLSRGDRYIVRYPSPPQTIGGGVVINPHPGRRWRRFQPAVIHHLETLMQGTPAQRIVQAAEGREPVSANTLQKLTGYDQEQLQNGIHEALAEGLLIEMPDGAFLAVRSYRAVQQELKHMLAAFHHAEPLRLGMPREELRSRLGLKNATLNMMISLQTDIFADGNLLRLADHQIRFSERQEARINELARQMNTSPYTPPTYAEAVDIVGEKVLRALIELGEIVQVQPDVIFSRAAYEEMVNGVLAIIEENGEIDAKSLRDRFDTSRKYAIGLLEHLDTVGITRRVGDVRVRGKR